MLVAMAWGLAGCPEDEEAKAVPPAPVPDAGITPTEDAGVDAEATLPPSTHGGLVSIQDITIANLPAAGHGLTVTAIFTPAAAPDFVEGEDPLVGCRAWSYDVATRPPPPEEDHGEIRIAGLANGALTCRFVPGRGYTCPTATGSGDVVVAAPSGATVSVSVMGAAFTSADVGRYLSLAGATSAGNRAPSAIVAVTSPTDVVLANPNAAAESFAGTYTVLAGAGPTPNDLYRPFTPGTPVTIGLVPGGASALAIPDTAVTPAAAFTLDEASKARVVSMPVTGEALTLGCASCGTAQGTILRITATDADVSGVSPVAMPPPKKKLVEIQCVRPGVDTVTIPAGAMDLLRAAHAVSPLTRIRTAFMREGYAITQRPAPLAPNPVYLLVGHGVLGFTKP